MKTGYILAKKKNNVFDILQWLLFYIIIFANMWAFWGTISVLDMIYNIAALGIFAIMLILLISRYRHKLSAMNVACVFGFIVWSLIMIYAFDIAYPTHGDKTFLFFTMDSYALSFIRMFIIILPCIAIMDYNHINRSKYTKYILLVILISSSIYMARAIQVNPDALRARGTMDYLGFGDLLKGVPDYGQVYAAALMLPALLYRSRKTKGFEKFCYVFAIILMSYIIIFAQFATALLIAIIGVLIYCFIISDKKKRIFIFILSMFIFIIVLFFDGGADILYWLSNRVQGAWSVKLEDIALVLTGQEDSGMVSSRFSYYSDSLGSFINNPIFGLLFSNGKIGGHATAIDILGLTGIFGFIPFAVCVTCNFLKMYKNAFNLAGKAVAISCFVQFVVLAFSKNIISAMAIFLAYYVIVPIILKAGRGENKQSEPTEKNNI